MKTVDKNGVADNLKNYFNVFQDDATEIYISGCLQLSTAPLTLLAASYTTPAKKTAQ